MKVQFIGELNVDLLARKLIEIAENTALRLEKEQNVKINGYGIHEAEVTVKYDVEGMEEPQLLTVEHHKGQPEIFTWIVDVDKDETASNEKESMYDAWTVAKAQGKEHQFKEVKSVYNLIDLEEIPELSEDFGDMSKKVYSHKDGFRVVKVFQNKKLIQEYKLIPKEKEQE
jgi:hypothetical protein